MGKKKKTSGSSTRKKPKQHRLSNLVRVYHDLESTLKGINFSDTGAYWVDRSIEQIDVSKLVSQLSKSKRRVKRKIKRGLEAERAFLRERLKSFSEIRKELRRAFSA